MTSFIVYSDPSHSWLEVDRALVRSLGILESISFCSYEQGDKLYLEEDCDVGKFLTAYKNENEDPHIEGKHTNGRSFVRDLSRFVYTVEEEQEEMKKEFSFELPRCVLELYRFCSNNSNRPGLSKIAVEKIDDLNFVAVAVDGHRLGLVNFKISHNGNDVMPDKFGIDAESAKQILKGAKKDNYYSGSFEAEMLRIKNCRSEVVSHSILGDFPDWRQIMPKDMIRGEGLIGINAQYVGDLGTYLKKVGLPPNVEFMVQDNLSPILFQAKIDDDTSFEAIVMPCKV